MVFNYFVREYNQLATKRGEYGRYCIFTLVKNHLYSIENNNEKYNYPKCEEIIEHVMWLGIQ